MKKIFLLIIIVLAYNSNCEAKYPYKPGRTANQHTTILKYKDYYKININLDSSNRKHIFKNYMQLILKACPDYEKLLDSYLAECSANNEYIHELFMENCDKIWPGLQRQYKNELKSMGSFFKNNPDIMNDGKLSAKEFYTLNLLPDVGRTTACSALTISKKLSKTSQLMVSRSLEWSGGSRNQLSRLHAITTIKNNKTGQAITMIGYLGMISCLTGFNNRGLFLGIIDSPLGNGAINPQKKNSYVFDLRYALENYSNSKAAGKFLKSARRKYTFNHLVIAADKKTALIIENNISENKRYLRTFGNALNPNINWENPQAICAVNSFVKKGNADNHTNSSYNYKRWNNYNRLLKESVDDANNKKITKDNLMEILAYRSFFPSSGNIYSKNLTQHSMIYIPETQKLFIYFKPDRSAPGKPAFKKIKFN